MNKFLVAFAVGVSADQPVHCLRGQIYGEWLFTLSETQTIDLHTINEVCTHKRPNLLQFISHDHEWQFSPVTSTYRITLQEENAIEAHLCDADGENCGESIGGFWSTIYD